MSRPHRMNTLPHRSDLYHSDAIIFPHLDGSAGADPPPADGHLQALVSELRQFDNRARRESGHVPHTHRPSGYLDRQRHFQAENGFQVSRHGFIIGKLAGVD